MDAITGFYGKLWKQKKLRKSWRIKKVFRVSFNLDESCMAFDTSKKVDTLQALGPWTYRLR